MKKRNHLILDLDETLLHSDDMSAADVRRMGRPPDYDLGDLRGYFRPHLREFLRYAFDNFASVGVWTAGTPDYAESIVSEVFDAQGLPRPAFVMNSRDCVARMENVGGQRYAKLKYKPLNKVWRRGPLHRASNTLILDDRTDTAWENAENLMLIPSFSVRSPLAPRDPFLRRFVQFSKQHNLPSVPDVRRVDKTQWWLPAKD